MVDSVRGPIFQFGSIFLCGVTFNSKAYTLSTLLKLIQKQLFSLTLRLAGVQLSWEKSLSVTLIRRNSTEKIFLNWVNSASKADRRTVITKCFIFGLFYLINFLLLLMQEHTNELSTYVEKQNKSEYLSGSNAQKVK